MKQIAVSVFALTLVAQGAVAQSLVSACYSRGSEADGVSGFTHYVNGRSIRVDSPRPGEPQTRVIEWQDPEFAQIFHDAMLPAWGDIPTDLLAQCDDGFRDTVVFRFDDGSMDRRDGSCIRNPLALALNAVFATQASLAENTSETRHDGVLEGALDPCAEEW